MNLHDDEPSAVLLQLAVKHRVGEPHGLLDILQRPDEKGDSDDEDGTDEEEVIEEVVATYNDEEVSLDETMSTMAGKSAEDAEREEALMEIARQLEETAEQLSVAEREAAKAKKLAAHAHAEKDALQATADQKQRALTEEQLKSKELADELAKAKRMIEMMTAQRQREEAERLKRSKVCVIS